MPAICNGREQFVATATSLAVVITPTYQGVMDATRQIAPQRWHVRRLAAYLMNATDVWYQGWQPYVAIMKSGMADPDSYWAFLECLPQTQSSPAEVRDFFTEYGVRIDARGCTVGDKMTVAWEYELC